MNTSVSCSLVSSGLRLLAWTGRPRPGRRIAFLLRCMDLTREFVALASPEGSNRRALCRRFGALRARAAQRAVADGLQGRFPDPPGRCYPLTLLWTAIPASIWCCRPAPVWPPPAYSRTWPRCSSATGCRRASMPTMARLEAVPGWPGYLQPRAHTMRSACKRRPPAVRKPGRPSV